MSTMVVTSCGARFNARAVRVLSGDTLVVEPAPRPGEGSDREILEHDGRAIPVRLIGVDAPPPETAAGALARRRLESATTWQSGYQLHVIMGEADPSGAGSCATADILLRGKGGDFFPLAELL